MYTDASLQGYGVVCAQDWQAGSFVPGHVPNDVGYLDLSHSHWLDMLVRDNSNINYLELLSIYMGVCRFAGAWKDQQVLCFTDNTQALAAVNNGVSVNPDSMAVLRSIFWICATLNIYLSARHVSGQTNLLADWLSRANSRGAIEVSNLPLCCCSGLKGTGS